jgi:EAL domain-containing protein (putative c-di-GMP-specific phosphodiesterase class I)
MSDMIYSKSFRAGEEIFCIGDRGRNAYMIERGEVEISNFQDGEQVVIATLGDGEIFGEMSMIDEAPRSATVRATKDTDAIVIQRSRYMGSFHSDNPMMNLIVRVILNRFRETQHLISGKTALDRVDDPSLTEIRDLALNRLNIEKDMRDALSKGEFAMNFQPIVSLDTGHLAGFEALMRWQKSDGSFVSPVEFIPLAEETGYIVELGRWALEDSLAKHKSLMQAWSKSFPDQPSPFMSVNVSGLQLSELKEIDALAGIIADSEVDPAYIKLEITETMMVENFAHATDALNKLKDLGTSIALDDFGTGYSSLSYLHQFPLDTIKIDRSFVVNMDQSTSSYRVVNGIARLALALETNIVAEGIEEKAQMDTLREMGCQYGQGYYMSRPLGFDQAIELIEKKTTW